MAKRLVLREVAGSGVWTRCWCDEKWGKMKVRVTDSDPHFSIFVLSEAQVMMVATKPTPG
jgi:hypothetical protein